MPIKRYPSTARRMLAKIRVQRLDRTHYLLTMPMGWGFGGPGIMTTEKVTKQQLENLVSFMTEIGAKVARAFRSPVPKTPPRTDGILDALKDIAGTDSAPRPRKARK